MTNENEESLKQYCGQPIKLTVTGQNSILGATYMRRMIPPRLDVSPRWD